jgi:uncharacterized protein YndB with AHSA1/START domain
MSTQTDSRIESTAQELVITRVFDAPRDLVFKAWTEPEQLIRWWGPTGFTTPSFTVDLRVGGVLHYCMRSPEGQDYWGIGVYREIVRPERIVYTDSFADARGDPVPPSHYGMSASHPAESLVSVMFAVQQGKTAVALRQTVPDSVQEREGMESGWTEMLGRLADDLAARPLSGTTRRHSDAIHDPAQSGRDHRGRRPPD